LPYSGFINVPVFIAMGERDSLFCGFVVATCTQAEALSNERPHYGAAPSVDAFVLPTAGYDVNLSPRTSELHQAVLAWTNGKV
jgi:hypothetical protein